jgi:hypothetical protein
MAARKGYSVRAPRARWFAAWPFSARFVTGVGAACDGFANHFGMKNPAQEPSQ